MRFPNPLKRLLLAATLLFFLCSVDKIKAQIINPSAFNMLQWRMIGPHRGGRTVGATGVVQQPNVFYIGVNNGGVWKTTDFGRTWQPVFDEQPTGSIGDVAVAPSNPGVIYAGSGEGIQRPDLSVGDGIYKSADSGKTWVNTGLKDAQQIGGLAIDPRNENKVFVAALGHPYGPNSERGVYRTTDGGKTWERVLYKDENTGAIQVTIDPNNPDIIYADMWAGRQGPWENGEWEGTESGLFKSTDGGTTWKKLTAGLPTITDGLGRIGFCIATSNSNRMYACVDAAKGGGLYRSDDGGESWKEQSTDIRLWERGDDFAECKVDPKNEDIVYIANVVTWKSLDGGKNWKAIRGAPGGDDYHRLWINPQHPEIILLASDQGAEITVNGGQTWSSWYNQPTAQFYHVSTDNAFPYNVYGGQQESGSIGIASRGNDGQITFREWHTVGAEEYGYVAADPLDPNIIYGGKLTRFDKRTGQVQNIAPEVSRTGKYRFVRTAPVVFSPVDQKTLFFAGNVLFKTLTGGNSWQVISPDLTRTTWDVPASVGIYTSEKLKQMPQRGVIYTVAPSNKNISTIWAGTDDGLIQLTNDGGKTWKNITPPEVTSWNKVSLIDAGHFDNQTAYAAINKIRLDDMNPYIYKTHDGGKTWKKIVTGLPPDPVNAVREDPICKGLLFAGTERMVYVSFNDGEYWQPLRFNMPATSIRDLVIKGNDLVVATHGRSFWILDDIAALRNLAKIKDASQTTLYQTSEFYRVRWNMNTDTPLPQEEPAGQNPPDGAIIDYYLKDNAKAVISLEILDATGKLMRVYKSDDKPYDVPPVNIPLYWIRPQQILATEKGSHRFVWDLHTQPLDLPPGYPIAAIYGQTAPVPTSPWVMPGNYTIKLTVDGKSYTQPLTVKIDPRVKTPLAQLQRQYDFSDKCYRHLKTVMVTMEKLNSLHEQINKLLPNASGELAVALKKTNADALKIENGTVGTKVENFNSLRSSLGGLMNLLQESEMPVTTQAAGAVNQADSYFNNLNLKYNEITGNNLKALNVQLARAGVKEISL
ncbi:WD40/YVTN/BNR-like repeat-containing protein [Mucilaginibacter xinganensis]|uniref:Xyloglucanase Xgh74A n=1 Tax=Mucilaginibacter xinganensis TaxID=1234841 RepID=A0A223NT21_9SPHI|nr:glycoside hydrolase [Mucilaginibacter xinganensis]ASU32661.1 Xyloglucanase Xgh74A precursor [Mucilaginibacter xinganensis]